MISSAMKVSIFSTIRKIAPALQETLQEVTFGIDLRVHEIRDAALHAEIKEGVPKPFKPENLHHSTLDKLRDTEILITEPASMSWK